MKTSVSSYQAKIKLPELLRQVQLGKSFTITNRGDAIADLVPSAKLPRDKSVSIEKMKSFMQADPVSGVDVKALISAGRK
ncbi:MAG: type II toxin-antitoxin system prevent-host-death family antitoxin [Gallionella sp.]|nr:type II toxin-antitoxin system prevent-host-death family antitoxin [Gallionella sp.]